MFKNSYQKLDGWPVRIVGILMLGSMAYYGFYTYQHAEAEKALILAELEAARVRQYELLQTINEKEGIIDSFQGQLSEIGSTVGVLEKLAKTDEELLKKYSKVYFLNENYIPARLAEIDKMYLVETAANDQIHAQVGPYLEKLLAKANQDGIKLRIASAYRSFETQSALKSNYKVLYGSGANQFSADQGYSEHQLGTAVDFTTEKLGAGFSVFVSDPAYQWLQDHAHTYGFILSYPPNNTYYKFEPWHWRFVGVALATKLHEEGKHFYDLDQREIDEYLVNLFD